MVSFPDNDYCYFKLLQQFTEKIVKLNNFAQELTQGTTRIIKKRK